MDMDINQVAAHVVNKEINFSNFDVDEYKIIRRFIRENKHLIKPFQLSFSI